MEMCPKCKSEMKKSGILNSGNTKFQEFLCPNCHNKVSRALGVNP